MQDANLMAEHDNLNGQTAVATPTDVPIRGSDSETMGSWPVSSLPHSRKCCSSNPDDIVGTHTCDFSESGALSEHTSGQLLGSSEPRSPRDLFALAGRVAPMVPRSLIGGDVSAVMGALNKGRVRSRECQYCWIGFGQDRQEDLFPND
jgi:hypothetical protein